ncbi:MAG: IMP dehydrogenase [Caldiserica bacterium]|nr:IMP dehydrogenase [Caldisericota bacterium]
MPGLREGLFFDDVMLLPRRSEVTASDVSLESRLSINVVLRSPFITSARQPAADYRLASTVARAGGIGFIPLSGAVEDQAHEVRKVKELMCKEDGAACDPKGRPVVGALVDLEREDILEYIGSLAEVWTDIIIVDVPHADRTTILRQIQAVKAEFDWLPLMVGNVQTRAGAKDVIDAGADIVVVGSGFSSFAEATELSGVGVPELSALMEVEDVASLYGRPIVCNMGVRSAASVVKALAAGASAVVLNTLMPDTASQVMAKVAAQVRESLSYVGARSIAELREKAEFIRIRPPYPV